jgi:ABC-type sugar transport system ATPase subunit
MLRGVLETLRDGRRTVVLVTHNLSQGLELADRVVVQVGGRWVSDEPRAAVDAGAFEQRLHGAGGGRGLSGRPPPPGRRWAVAGKDLRWRCARASGW